MKTQQRRSRSCSPTKESPQYRNTVLKRANILVDVVHILPPDIETLLPFDLRDILDPSPLDRTRTDSNTSTLEEKGRENNTQARQPVEKIRQLAAVYRDESRELAGKPGSEPGYRTHLYSDIVVKLLLC